MHHQFVLLLLGAFAGSSIALPTALVQPKAFELRQVPNGKKHLSGPIQLARAYGKYAIAGAVAPDNVQAAALAAQQGSVSANPEDWDVAYLCPVTIGGQTLNLNLDTGSSDLWVFSTQTPASQTAGQTRYNPSVSGKRISGATWNMKYGDGSVGASGVVYADKVVVGGVTATSQAVEAATSVSSIFTEDTNTDGLLGLAFSSINQVKPTPQMTFFDTVKSTLNQKLFAVDLRKGKAGSFDFGFINTSKYTGSITYTSVASSSGFWQFTAGSYTIGTLTSSPGSIGTAVADTGTTLLLIPSAAVKNYYAKVSGSSYSEADGGYIFPCSASLPAFNVNIGSRSFAVPGSLINFAPISDTQCYGGIQSNDGFQFSIFGGVFLRSVYAIFDQTQSAPRLGFAKQA